MTDPVTGKTVYELRDDVRSLLFILDGHLDYRDVDAAREVARQLGFNLDRLLRRLDLDNENPESVAILTAKALSRINARTPIARKP